MCLRFLLKSSHICSQITADVAWKQLVGYRCQINGICVGSSIMGSSISPLAWHYWSSVKYVESPTYRGQFRSNIKSSPMLVYEGWLFSWSQSKVYILSLPLFEGLTGLYARIQKYSTALKKLFCIKKYYNLNPIYIKIQTHWEIH